MEPDGRIPKRAQAGTPGMSMLARIRSVMMDFYNTRIRKKPVDLSELHVVALQQQPPRVDLTAQVQGTAPVKPGPRLRINPPEVQPPQPPQPRQQPERRKRETRWPTPSFFSLPSVTGNSVTRRNKTTEISEMPASNESRKYWIPGRKTWQNSMRDSQTGARYPGFSFTVVQSGDYNRVSNATYVSNVQSIDERRPLAPTRIDRIINSVMLRMNGSAFRAPSRPVQNQRTKGRKKKKRVNRYQPQANAGAATPQMRQREDTTDSVGDETLRKLYGQSL